MEKIKESLDYIRCRRTNPRLENWIEVHDYPAVMNAELVPPPAAPLFRRFNAPYCFEDIVGLDVLKAEARQLAASRYDILICGESGTGKEMFASAIHNADPRARGLFVPVNCNAIPANLLETELFGYVRGAFTDARDDKPGKMVHAQDGTMFFDEIGDLALESQGKLLRVLDNHEIYPIGSNQAIKIRARFIFATNRNLELMVAQGKFREDLFFRINPITIQIPPLRERKQELLDLIHHFLCRIQRSHDDLRTYGKHITGLTKEALQRLHECEFRGNVRELEGMLRRACIKCREEQISLIDLGLKKSAAQPLSQLVDEFQRRVIRERVIKYQGNALKAATDLKISLRSLYRYLNKNHHRPVKEAK